MYPQREVFPDAPVVVVTAEARFTDAPRLRQKETLDAVAIALEATFPFTEPLSGVDVQPLGAGLPPQVSPRQGVLLRNADRTEALTVTATHLVYETTVYGGFEALHATLHAACQALVEARVAPELTRVGLRYIDEIRVPEPVTDARQWSAWIDRSLLGPMSVTPDHVPARVVQGAVGFDLGGRGGLQVQYGAFAQGSTNTPPHLRRPPAPAGPFFALDLDGFYAFGDDESVRLDPGVVTDILAKVHAPIGAAFHSCVTDRARTLFRGDAGSPNNGAGSARHRSPTEPPAG